VTARENQLEQIESDCNNIERQIRDTTCEPFRRKEGAASLAVRVNELEEKLRERQRYAQDRLEEEKKELETIEAARA